MTIILIPYYYQIDSKINLHGFERHIILKHPFLVGIMKFSEYKSHYIKYGHAWCWNNFRFTSGQWLWGGTHDMRMLGQHILMLWTATGDGSVFLTCTIWIHYPYYDEVNSKIFSILTNWFEGVWPPIGRLHPMWFWIVAH